MRKLFIVLTAVFLAATSSLQAQEVDLSEPYKMVRQVADNTFKRVERDQQKIQADKEYLKVI